jgi:hypothetical protein
LTKHCTLYTSPNSTTIARARYIKSITHEDTLFEGDVFPSALRQVTLSRLNCSLGDLLALNANPDGNNEIEIQYYNTSSKVTVKDLEEEMRKHGQKG